MDHVRVFTTKHNNKRPTFNKIKFLSVFSLQAHFAEKVFDEMPMRDFVSWNSMIGGYVLDGDGWKSLSYF